MEDFTVEESEKRVDEWLGMCDRYLSPDNPLSRMNWEALELMYRPTIWQRLSMWWKKTIAKTTTSGV